MFISQRILLLLFGLLPSVFAVTGLAVAQDVEVAWIPPATGPVAGYNVYVAPLVAGPLIASPINVGRPTVDGAGVARARVSVQQAPNLMIEMTSYDASGRESARSNRVVLARGPEYVDPPIWSTGFSSEPIGSRAGFVGGDFAVNDYPTGNRVLGVARTAGLMIGRFLGTSSYSAEPYELSGRMFLALQSRLAGVAMRVPLVGTGGNPFGAGFRLGGDASGRFSLESNSGLTLECAGSNSTGVTSTALRWFRFRVRYTEPDDNARIRAKVWADGTAEPTGWQVDCSTPVLPPANAGRFALYKDGFGSVYWDDLAVAPVRGWWDQIPYL